jgi:alpha-D-ribose 1-methylphosphonate 5-triphosphate synthase subunit PhnI
MPRAPFPEMNMSLIKKTLHYRGTESDVFFRELTAGEALDLARSVRAVKSSKSGELEYDFGANLENSQRLLQMTLVDEDGKNVYRNAEQLRKEPAKKIAKLIALANEVVKEEEPEGNA